MEDLGEPRLRPAEAERPALRHTGREQQRRSAQSTSSSISIPVPTGGSTSTKPRCCWGEEGAQGIAGVGSVINVITGRFTQGAQRQGCAAPPAPPWLLQGLAVQQPEEVRSLFSFFWFVLGKKNNKENHQGAPPPPAPLRLSSSVSKQASVPRCLCAHTAGCGRPWWGCGFAALLCALPSLLPEQQVRSAHSSSLHRTAAQAVCAVLWSPPLRAPPPAAIEQP